MRHIKHDVQERWWRQERRKQRLSQSSTSPEEKEVSKEVVAAKPPEENEVSAAHSRAGELPRSTTSSCAPFDDLLPCVRRARLCGRREAEVGLPMFHEG